MQDDTRNPLFNSCNVTTHRNFKVLIIPSWALVGQFGTLHVCLKFISGKATGTSLKYLE